MAANLPIRFQELLQLTNLGVNSANISFNNVTLQSDKYICVRDQQGDQNSLVIVDMANPQNPARNKIGADAAIMNPSSNILALKAGNQLQVFNMGNKERLKSHVIDEPVVFWTWLNDTTIGMITGSAVYHWTIGGADAPVKQFERHASLADTQIINYRADSKLKWFCIVGIAQRDGRIAGSMQLYSAERKVSQVLEGHACAFADFQQPGASAPSTLFCFAKRSASESKLYIIEVAKPDDAPAFTKRQADIFFPSDAAQDFPVSMQVSPKYNIIFVVTKFAYVFLMDLETGNMIYNHRISRETIFTTTYHSATGGIMGVERSTGRVLLVGVNEQTLVPHITSTLNDYEMAIRLAKHGKLPGAEDLFAQQFRAAIQKADYATAAKVASDCPALRTEKTIQGLKGLPTPQGQRAPILQYLVTMVGLGKLNAAESLELVAAVLQSGNKQYVANMVQEDKLTGSEALGDLLKPHDVQLAMRMYYSGECHAKMVMSLAEAGQFDKIVPYTTKTGYKADYPQLIQAMLQTNPQGVGTFAAQLVNAPGGPLVDVNQVVDLLMSKGLIQPLTSLLLDVLKGNKPEEGPLQTKLLEINLMHAPTVADAILGNEMLTHYDKQRIGTLCEKAGLSQRALEHYTELNDRKRVLSNTNNISAEFLVEYFSRLKVEDSLECLKQMLRTNIRQNLKTVVQICIKYSETLTPEKVVDLLESFKSFEGLFFFLQSMVGTSEDPVVHNKYIEAAARTGNTREVERVVRESNHYDPAKIRDFLKEARLSDQLPLIIVCDRFDFIPDLTQYLYKNNMSRYIEAYVSRINPHNTPLVIGALIDVGCNEDYIKSLLMNVRGMCPIEQLVEEVEKRHKLKLVLPWLESRANEGNQEPDLHNSLAKIYIDSNREPKKFLEENQYYDPIVVGKYCEKRDPQLAFLAYKRGQCDDELIEVTNKNGLFKNQARYMVHRQDPELWAKGLAEDNEYRRQLIDQVVQTALPESDSTDEVSVAVEAFMSADLPNELIELLDKIVLDNKRPEFSENPSLQNLLILTAIKVDKSRVMNYINRLNKYDAKDIASVAVGASMYEEGFTAYKKAGLHEEAIEVMIDHMDNLDEAASFAEKIGDNKVFSKLAKAHLDKGNVQNAMVFFIKADDAEFYNEVIYAANEADTFDELVKYLKMCRLKLKDPRIESELVFAYAKTNNLSDLEELISTPGCVADILGTGDRCYEAKLFEASKILYASTDNHGKLASALVQLKEFSAAIDAAKKANSIRTWREVNLACVIHGEFDKARTAGLFILKEPDELPSLVDVYESRGHFPELIQLLERGKQDEENCHPVMLTELATLYSKYNEEKLMDFLRQHHANINIPRIIHWTQNNRQYAELVFLYNHYNEHDNALMTMMDHAEVAFEHSLFKDTITKVNNGDLYYQAIQFYTEQQPLQVNDLLATLVPHVDHARVVQLARRLVHLPLVKPYLESVQDKDVKEVNEALNELYTEEEDFDKLRHSIDNFENFDQLALAKSLESHELLEFRRIAAYVYRNQGKFDQSVELSKADKLYKDAIETAAASGKQEVAEELLSFFVKIESKECFAAALYVCYDSIRPDVALELAWRNNMMDQAFPFLINVLREYTGKIDALQKESDKRKKDQEKKQEQPNSFQAEETNYMNQMPQIAYYPEGGMAPGMMPQQGFDPSMQGGFQQPGYGQGFQG